MSSNQLLQPLGSDPLEGWLRSCDESVPASAMTLAPPMVVRHRVCMPRPHRVQASGVTYHAFAQATGSEMLHRDDEDRQRFLRILAATVDKYRLEVHFVVVLGTHHHVLLTTTRPNIAAAMQNLSGIYCQSYNRRHGRKGHLVAGRYGTK